MKVLLVDNSLKARREYKIFWSMHGHDVTATSSIEEAETLIAETDFERHVIDGSIKIRADGADFAKRLGDEGKNVVILSTDPKAHERTGVRLVHKTKDKGPLALMTELLSPEN